MFRTSSRRLIFGGPVIALGSIGKSLSAVKWELSKLTWRPATVYCQEHGCCYELPVPLSVVFHSSVCCFRHEFATASACSSRWRTAVWVGWQGWSAIRSFWHQAVQGVCWSADLTRLRWLFGHPLALELQFLNRDIAWLVSRVTFGGSTWMREKLGLW